MWLYAVLGLAAIACASWCALDVYPRRKRRRRFMGRRSLDDNAIVASLGIADVTRETALELWDEVAGFADVPRDLLRADDRFEVELAPEAGWELDSEVEAVELAARRRASSKGASIPLGRIATVRDYVQELGKL